MHLLFYAPGHLFQKRLVFGTPLFQLRGNLPIILCVKMLECQILKLAAQFAHAQTVRNRRVDVHSLLRNATTLFRFEELKRAHVVKSVSEFHKDYAHVLNHSEQHFSYVLGLLLLLRDVAYLRNLCQPVN